MSDLSERIANLSPEKRALLTLHLRKKGAKAAREATIPKRKDQSTFPLSFAQERLWFLDQYEPDSPYYNVPAALQLTGPIDIAALRQSLNEIVRRHEVLRATFVSENGRPVQFLAPELILSLPMTNLQEYPTLEREDRILQLATKEAQRPFSLSRGPLVRANLIKLGEEQHVLLLTMHHIVFDGWSTEILLTEMAALYEAFCFGQPSPLSELPIQYADYALWQREALRGETLEQQLNYWKGRLDGQPGFLELPFTYSRPPFQTYQGAHYAFDVPQSIFKKLKALSREADVTLFMTFLGAFKVLLNRISGQSDISVGIPNANRSRLEVEKLIGFFVNTLVVRTDLKNDLTFKKLLKRVRELTLGAYAHQDLPFV